MKTLNKEERCFTYLQASFPGLSEEKLNIFDGPQLRKKMVNDPNFSDSMTEIEKHDDFKVGT